VYLSTSSVNPSVTGTEKEKNNREITEIIMAGRLVFNTGKNLNHLSASSIPAAMKEDNVIYAEKIFVVYAEINNCL
jgi:hypothetical protein